MDIQDKSPTMNGGKRQVAYDMGEALSYLISVALSAGLSDVARKLNDIHLELQFLQLSAGEDEQSTGRSGIRH